MSARRRCQSCQAEIEFVTLPSGRKIPIDLEPSPLGNMLVSWVDGSAIVLDGASRAEHTGALYVSHFATCPYASRHRR